MEVLEQQRNGEGLDRSRPEQLAKSLGVVSQSGLEDAALTDRTSSRLTCRFWHTEHSSILKNCWQLKISIRISAKTLSKERQKERMREIGKGKRTDQTRECQNSNAAWCSGSGEILTSLTETDGYSTKAVVSYLNSSREREDVCERYSYSNCELCTLELIEKWINKFWFLFMKWFIAYEDFESLKATTNRRKR